MSCLRLVSSQITKNNFLLLRVAVTSRAPQSVHLTTSTLRRAEYKHPSEKPRLTCPQPPPYIPPPKDDRLLWGTLAFFVITGAFIVYAKEQPEVRDWLTLYAPWFDDIIAFLYEENYSHQEFFLRKKDEWKKAYDTYMSLPEECCGPPKKQDLPCDPCEMRAEYERRKKLEDQPCDYEKEKTPIVEKDVCELEECVREYSELAMSTLAGAIEVSNNYTKAVKKAMLTGDPHAYSRLRDAMKDRKETIVFAKNTCKDAKAQLDAVKYLASCKGICGPPDKIAAFKDLMCGIDNNIKSVEKELQLAETIANLHDRQWLIVEDFMNRFAADIKGYYTKINWTSESPNVDLEDLDFLLIHTKKYYNAVLEDLVENAVPNLGIKLSNAINDLTACYNDLQKKAFDAQFSGVSAKTGGGLAALFAEREKELKIDLENKGKEKLAKQKATLEAEEKQKLLAFESVVKKRFEEEAEKLIRAERIKMAAEKKEAKDFLAIVEDRLASRIKAEEESKRSQLLWNAGTSILKALKNGDDNVRVDYELIELKKLAGTGDKLLQTLLKSIPSSVGEKGLVSEAVLIRKYHTMEDMALKVALIEETGAPLVVYALSFLQSALLFFKLNTLPTVELETPPQEPFKDLDTFDLMRRARFYMLRGNIAAALRYVNSLEGASRSVAEPWTESARCYIQTKQAAEAILAHASSMAMKYI